MKRYSSNMSFFIHLLKKNMISSFTYFGIIFVLNTLPFYLIYREEVGKNVENHFHYFSFYEWGPYEILLFLGGAMIISGWVYRRLFNREYLEVLLSTEVTKKKTHLAFMTVALMNYGIPLLVNGGLLLLLAHFYNPASMIEIVYFLAYGLLIGFTLIATMALMASVAGNVPVQIVLTLAFQLLPIGMYILVSEGLYQFIQGVLALDYFAGYWYYLSPLGLLIRQFLEILYGAVKPDGIVDQLRVLLYVGLVDILMILVSVYTLKYKKLETRLWLNQKRVRYLFLIVTSLFFGLAFGLISVFSILERQSLLNFLISSLLGLLVGFFIGYFISYGSMKFYLGIKKLAIIGFCFYLLLIVLGVIGSRYYGPVTSRSQVESISIWTMNYRESKSSAKELMQTHGYYDLKTKSEFYRQDFSYMYHYPNEYETEEAKGIIMDYIDSIDPIINLVPDKEEKVNLLVGQYLVDGEIQVHLYKELDRDEKSDLNRMYENLYKTKEYFDKSHPILIYDKVNLKSVEVIWNDEKGTKQTRIITAPKDLETLGEVLEEIVREKSQVLDETSKLICKLTYSKNNKEIIAYETISRRMNEIIDIVE